MAIINERIKERRLKLNLTLLQVAEYLSVKEATAQRYESGKIKDIKHETIIKLAKLLKCSPAYLMGWEDDPDPNKSILNTVPIQKSPRLSVAVEDEVLDLLNQLRIRPEMKMLFSEAKGATKADVEKAAKLIKFFKEDSQSNM